MKFTRFFSTIVSCILVTEGCTFCFASGGGDGKYTLKQEFVFARHGVRSPDSKSITSLTEHKWISWPSHESELSPRGGCLEMMMGSSFRKHLIDRGVIDYNWVPKEGEVLFSANSLQRTGASTYAFVAGFSPADRIDVEMRNARGVHDPKFKPQLTFSSDRFTSCAIEQIKNLNGCANNLNEIYDKISDNLKILEGVLDLKHSEYAKINDSEGFKRDDIEMSFDEGKEPSLKGSLKLARDASSALAIQKYESMEGKNGECSNNARGDENALKSSFGNDLTPEEWEKIGEIIDVYQKVLFGSPIVAINVAHPILIELKNELSCKGRIFSYFCAHDSNINTILSSLRMSPYTLKDSLTKIPMGCKLVFEKWIDENNNEYIKVFLVYYSTSQIKNCSISDSIPHTCELEFNDMRKNDDGFYSMNDVLNRINDAIDAYDYMKVFLRGDNTTGTIEGITAEKVNDISVTV